MLVMTVHEARAKFDPLIETVAQGHEPVFIVGSQSGAVLISEAHWRAIQETLHLLSIPGMRQSIRRAIKTPIAKCRGQIDW